MLKVKLKATDPDNDRLIFNSSNLPFGAEVYLLGDVDLAAKIIGPLAERYKDRNGGYVRIIKAGFRPGDNAAMAIIELVDRDLSAKGKDSGPTAEKTQSEDKPEGE